MTPAEKAKMDELIRSHNMVLSHLRHMDAVFAELNNYRWFRFIMWIRPLAMPQMKLPRIVNTIADPIQPKPIPVTTRVISMDAPPEFNDEMVPDFRKRA